LRRAREIVKSTFYDMRAARKDRHSECCML